MRKKRAFIIVLTACLFCACTKTSVISGSHQSVHHEFGESVHEKEYEDTYVMNLIYPKTNIKDVDEKIKQTLESYKRDFTSQQFNSETNRAELNVDYQSYIKDDRYISIKLDIFINNRKQSEMIETMIYDLKKERFLAYEDLFDQAATEKLSEIIQTKLKAQYPKECSTKSFMIHTAASAHNFDRFILRKKEMVFYFDAHTVLDQSAYVEVSYEEMKDHISMEQEEESVVVPYQDVLNEPVKQIDKDKPMVALTFDDGPTLKYTSAILDCLKEHQASATFFVLGSRADDFPQLLQRMILEGNEIGNHTFSHKQLTTLSKANIEEEISATQESIYSVTNRYPKIIRPPYGSKNETVLQCAQDKKIVTWTIDSEDWRSRNAETIVNKVVKEVKDGDIILMHDLYASTAEAAIILIPKLQEMGYQLVTISELYEYGKNDAGKIM